MFEEVARDEDVGITGVANLQCPPEVSAKATAPKSTASGNVLSDPDVVGVRVVSCTSRDTATPQDNLSVRLPSIPYSPPENAPLQEV